MNRRLLALAVCMLLIGAVVLLVPSLGRLHFEPARPLAIASSPVQPIVFPIVSTLRDVSLLKILLFWLAMVVNLSLLLVLLSPEARKRVLRQLIRFAVGILAFVLLLKYRVLQWPLTSLEPPAAGQLGSAGPALPLEEQTFRPPEVAAWAAYALSAIVFWIGLLVLYIAYRTWQRHRTRRLTTLDSIADIARASLADLSAGRQWGDVVIETYARMNDAVWRVRGLQRESSATPREFALRLARTGLPASAVDELTRLFESVRYGGRTSDPGTGRRAVACLESILQACQAAA